MSVPCEVWAETYRRLRRVQRQVVVALVLREALGWEITPYA